LRLEAGNHGNDASGENLPDAAGLDLTEARRCPLARGNQARLASIQRHGLPAQSLDGRRQECRAHYFSGGHRAVGRPAGTPCADLSYQFQQMVGDAPARARHHHERHLLRARDDLLSG
jgi:hypothetical protein